MVPFDLLYYTHQWLFLQSQDWLQPLPPINEPRVLLLHYQAQCNGQHPLLPLLSLTQLLASSTTTARPSMAASVFFCHVHAGAAVISFDTEAGPGVASGIHFLGRLQQFNCDLVKGLHLRR